MKSKIQAIINSDLEDLLIQTNQLEPLLDGRIKCCICNRTITMENIGLLLPVTKNGKQIFDFCCNDLDCLQELNNIVARY